MIGGGITSAATSAFLAEKLVGKNVQITIWDKARGAGGRMSTSRSSGNPDCIADLGAQYITVTPEYAAKHGKIHQELIESHIMKPLKSHVEGLKSKDGVTDYVTCQAGMSSIVKHFFKKSGIDVNFNHHINHISIKDDKIQVSTQNGKSEMFDSALMTMPVPQILQLPGMDKILSKNLTKKLTNVKYSSRYALALFYDKYEPDVQLSQDVIETGAHYITDDPIFCYAGIDGLKKGLNNSPTSVVFHTKVPWGIKQLETPIPEVEKILVEHYQKRYPNWPSPISVKCLRWRYSQVSTPYDGFPGAIILNENPLLIAAGDGFVHRSGLDACLESATKACDIFCSKL